jgi:hypothetical protein
MKALLSLDRARGNLLEKHNIVFDDAIRGSGTVMIRGGATQFIASSA